MPTVQRLEFQSLVTFGPGAPMLGFVTKNADRIADMASKTGAPYALVDVPAFMTSLIERRLLERNIAPLHAWGQVYRYAVDTEVDDVKTIRCAYKILEFIEIMADGSQTLYQT